MNKWDIIQCCSLGYLIAEVGNILQIKFPLNQKLQSFFYFDLGCDGADLVKHYVER